MDTVRDRFWIWGHEAGSHNKNWNLPGASRITPVEAAHYMGVPNLIEVVYANEPRPPFDQYALAMQSLERVVWSIVGDSGSKRNDDKSDLDDVLDLAAKFPNITGAMMDDFFIGGTQPDAPVARYSVEAIAGFRDRLHAAARPLDLWVVTYDQLLDRPIRPHLEQCDVATFWTWRAENLTHLEKNFARLEAAAPKSRKVLGCYMWDYGTGQPMPVALMQRQCELGLDWLRAGRIEGMIFLATCICDLRIEAVEWTRAWIGRVGATRLG